MIFNGWKWIEHGADFLWPAGLELVSAATLLLAIAMLVNLGLQRTTAAMRHRVWALAMAGCCSSPCFARSCRNSRCRPVSPSPRFPLLRASPCRRHPHVRASSRSPHRGMRHRLRLLSIGRSSRRLGDRIPARHRRLLRCVRKRNPRRAIPGGPCRRQRQSVTRTVLHGWLGVTAQWSSSGRWGWEWDCSRWLGPCGQNGAWPTAAPRSMILPGRRCLRTSAASSACAVRWQSASARNPTCR